MYVFSKLNYFSSRATSYGSFETYLHVVVSLPITTVQIYYKKSTIFPTRLHVRTPNEDSDQTVHPRSLIKVFKVYLLVDKDPKQPHADCEDLVILRRVLVGNICNPVTAYLSCDVR